MPKEKSAAEQTGHGPGRDMTFMLYTIAVILLVLWLVGWLGFHLLGAAIHVLLLLAIICFILGLVRRV